MIQFIKLETIICFNYNYFRLGFAYLSLGGASEEQVRTVVEYCLKAFPMRKPN